MTERLEHHLCREDRAALDQLLHNQAALALHFSAFVHLYHQDQKTMEQALADAVARSTASEAAAAAALADLAQTNTSLVQANAALKEQLTAAQAAAGDPAAEQAAATSLNTSADTLDAAVKAAKPPAPTAISISPTSITGAAGNGLTGAFSASGGTAPYTFAADAAWPPNLTLAPDGSYSGTPAAPENASSVVTVTDASGASATATVSISIN